MGSKKLVYITDNLTGMGEYGVNVWHGALDGAHEGGAQLLCLIGGAIDKHPLNPFEGTRNFVYDVFDPEDADGIIITGGTLGNHTTKERYVEYCNRLLKKPTISISPATEKVPYIVIDNSIGLKNLITHLIDDHGSKLIGFVTGALTNNDAKQRLAAYKEVMSHRGLVQDQSLVFEGDWTHLTGEPAVAHFLSLKPRPDAIVCSNDNMAIGVINALQAKGIKVPEDIKVTGFDNTEEAATNYPKITTVQQPVYELSKEAVKILLRAIDSNSSLPMETVIPTKVIKRDSCGCSSALQHKGETDKAKTIEEAVASLLSSNAAKASLPQVLIRDLEMWTRSFIKHIAEPDKTIFAQFEEIIRKYRTEHTITFMEMLLSEMQNFLLHAMDYQSNMSEAIRFLEAARSIVQELKIINLQRNRRETEMLSSLLVETNRALAGSFNLDDLEGLIIKSFPGSGINALDLVLTNEADQQVTCRHIVSMINGKPNPNHDKNKTDLETRKALNTIWAKANTTPVIALPLYFRNDKLGIAFFHQTTKIAFVYDALTLQLSTNIEGTLLVKKLTDQEKWAERQNRELTEMIVPMIERLQNIAHETSVQGTRLNDISTMNIEASSRVSRANTLFQSIRQELESIHHLLATINDISETVSVVSINASISAARAGDAGKVFSVIANEIRSLSTSTNQRTEEASRVISTLSTNATDYVSSNNKTMEAFENLSEQITKLTESLNQITGHIENLAERGAAILEKVSST